MNRMFALFFTIVVSFNLCACSVPKTEQKATSKMDDGDSQFQEAMATLVRARLGSEERKANPFGLPDPSMKFTSDVLDIVEREIENLKAPPEYKLAWYHWLAQQRLELLLIDLRVQ